MPRFLIIFLFSITPLLHAATAEEVFSKSDSLLIGIISAVPGESGQILEYMESLTVSEREKEPITEGSYLV